MLSSWLSLLWAWWFLTHPLSHPNDEMYPRVSSNTEWRSFSDSLLMLFLTDEEVHHKCTYGTLKQSLIPKYLLKEVIWHFYILYLDIFCIFYNNVDLSWGEFSLDVTVRLITSTDMRFGCKSVCWNACLQESSCEAGSGPWYLI